MNFQVIEMIPFSAEQQLLLQRATDVVELGEICEQLELNEELSRLAFELRGFNFEAEELVVELPNINQDLSLHSHYVNHIAESMGEPIAHSLNRTLIHCWERINNRKNETVDTNYGLVVGRIQSGKTAHLLGLSSIFLSTGYDTLVILSGGIDDLRHQVMERIDDIGFPNTVLVIPNGPDLRHNEQAQNIIFSHFNSRRVDRKLIIVIKKHISHINCLSDLVQESRGVCKQRRKVLIVDDECDYASRDNNHAEGRERPLDPEEISPTNQSIRRLIIRLRATNSPTWYIGYTATPFANLLIQEDSSTEESQFGLSLYPRNFIYCLPQPQYHRDNEYYFLEENENVRILDDETHEKYSPINFQNLILLHFISYIIKTQLRDIQGPHMTMVHTDILTREHREIRESIEDARNRINRENSENIKRRLLATRIRHYPHLSGAEATNFRELIDGYDGRRLKRRIREIPIIELNRRIHEENQEIDNSEEEIISIPTELRYPTENFSGIVVGGTRVSRGLTIKGLTITWFTRSANEPSYDTMLQQARWCGYRTSSRNSYADLVRIFTERQIEEQFHTISLAEQDLRSQLEDMEDDVDPVEQRIFIQRHDGFKITGRMPPRLGPLDIQGEIAERNTICQYPSIFRSSMEPNESNSVIFQNFVNFYRRKIRTNLVPIPNPDLSGYELMTNIRKRDIQNMLQIYFDSYQDAEDVDTKRKLRQILNRFANENITSLNFWNVAIRRPYRNTATFQSRRHTFRLVNRGFSEDGYAGRVWSGTSSSIIDLQEGEVRTMPLLLVYLANHNYQVNGRDVFPSQPAEPVLLFHIILPSEALGQGIVRVQRYREEDW